MRRLTRFGTSCAALAALGLSAAVMTAEARPSAGRPGMVVQLVGADVGEVRDLSHLTSAPGASEALCFDVTMVDPTTGRVLGTASDCLLNVQPVGDGMSLTAVTIFNFPGGSVINEGQTTVQPTTIGSPGITHITGAIPGAGDGTIIGGTGRFRHASGSARLSGAVDLSQLASSTEITFDCLFVLDFD